MKDLTKGNTTKLILGFALPILIGYLLQLTYSLVDTRIVGSTLGESSLAAVGATSSVSGLIIGFLQGMTNGFAVIVSQHFGAKDYKRVKKSVALSVGIGLLCSIVLTVGSLIFLKPLLVLLNIPADVLDLSSQYISVIFAGMTISMLYNVCASVLRAIGDTVTPLIFLSISVVLNIFGDLYFITELHMGVRGAAAATVLAQFIALVACVIYMWKKYDLLRFGLRDMKPESALIRPLTSSGLSMGFMSSFVALGTVALQTSINSLGTDYIVIHTAARKITEIFMLSFVVLGTTMATFCGQNKGADRYDRIREGVRNSILISFAWCAFVVLLSFTVSPWMISAVTATTKPFIISQASLYLKVDTSFYFVTAVICIVRNAMQGIGDHLTPVISSFIELAGKVVIAAFLVPKLGYLGVILAEPIVWFLMVIPLLIQLFRNPIFNAREFLFHRNKKD